MLLIFPIHSLSFPEIPIKKINLVEVFTHSSLVNLLLLAILVSDFMWKAIR